MLTAYYSLRKSICSVQLANNAHSNRLPLNLAYERHKEQI